jgi:adenosylcobinamide-GDP ribazoletransferase
MLKQELLRFLASFVFFSRIPFISVKQLSEIHFNKAIRYLPWVGFVVSFIGAAIMYYASYILPQSVAVILGISITLLLTGAFHEDGFADTCDGFGGGYSKPHILEIMKDSHIGTYGVIGLIMILLIKFAALSEMPRFFMAVFFITGNTLSRYVLISVMYNYSYARDESSSKVKIVLGEINIADFVISFIPVIPAFLITGDLVTLLFVIPVWFTKWIMAKYFKSKIGGYTGDSLGAIQQVCEVIFYISALIWLKYTW